MKSKILAAALAASMVMLAGTAQAAGCIKGAVVGGIAGHYVGKGHAVLGAVTGCAVGHHLAKVKRQEQATARAGGGTAH
jgi:outer membrane lipoprotein SlyB